MNFAYIDENDIVDSDEGLCVSLWFRGCEWKCKGCHNPELWSFGEINPREERKGIIPNDEVVNILKDKLLKNGVQRNLSILGGEPLHPRNREDCFYIIKEIRKSFPDIKIILWTGYTYENLVKEKNKDIKNIFRLINVLIDGPFILGKRDTTLKLRGSSNQRILFMKKGRALNLKLKEELEKCIIVD